MVQTVTLTQEQVQELQRRQRRGLMLAGGAGIGLGVIAGGGGVIALANATAPEDQDIQPVNMRQPAGAPAPKSLPASHEPGGNDNVMMAQKPAAKNADGKTTDGKPTDWGTKQANVGATDKWGNPSKAENPKKVASVDAAKPVGDEAVVVASTGASEEERAAQREKDLARDAKVSNNIGVLTGVATDVISGNTVGGAVNNRLPSIQFLGASTNAGTSQADDLAAIGNSIAKAGVSNPVDLGARSTPDAAPLASPATDIGNDGPALA